MAWLDPLFSLGVVRRLIWRAWYPFLTRRLRDEDVVFLNYAYETDPPLGLALAREDAPDRGCIQLYHQAVGEVALAGKHVLEVSCGHGGGAAYLTRTRAPARYTGLDFNAAGIRFCRRRHRVERLDFVVGDAQRLPFPPAIFDAVVNIEASHCYPDFARFLAEAARVLGPGGHLFYADFRFGSGRDGRDFSAWDTALAESPFVVVQVRDIGPEVKRGMELNAARSRALVERHLPGFLRGLGHDFAGVPGSRVYTALAQGRLSYRSYLLQKIPD